MAGGSAVNRMVRLQTCMALKPDNLIPSPCHLPPLKFPSHFLSSKQAIKLTGVSSAADAPPVFMPQNKCKPSLNQLTKLIIHLNDDLSPLVPLPNSRPPPRNSWTQDLQIFIEKGIVSCQSFTLIAVAGSLIGSILCFLEGCFLVLKSSTEFFNIIPSKADQAQNVKLLVESLDMFLVGTALLTFGMALYLMFVGSNEMRQTSKSQIGKSNSGNFNLKKLKQGMETGCIVRAKTKVGHAILLLLQAGMMEKFTNVPLVSGLDLACFAGAVVVSAASVFLLSRLTVTKTRQQSSTSTLTLANNLG